MFHCFIILRVANTIYSVCRTQLYLNEVVLNEQNLTVDKITCCDYCTLPPMKHKHFYCELDNNGANCSYSNNIRDNTLCNVMYTLPQPIQFNRNHKLYDLVAYHNVWFINFLITDASADVGKKPPKSCVTNY